MNVFLICKSLWIKYILFKIKGEDSIREAFEMLEHLSWTCSSDSVFSDCYR